MGWTLYMLQRPSLFTFRLSGLSLRVLGSCVKPFNEYLNQIFNSVLNSDRSWFSYATYIIQTMHLLLPEQYHRAKSPTITACLESGTFDWNLYSGQELQGRSRNCRVQGRSRSIEKLLLCSHPSFLRVRDDNVSPHHGPILVRYFSPRLHT